MLLSKSCIYGIRAAVYLALNRNGKYVPVREISENLDISFHFLTKICRKLSSGGIIKSIKGAQGGLKFERDPENISIMEIVIAIDGNNRFSECLLGLPDCGILKPCPLHDDWFDAIESIKEKFNDITVNRIAEEVRTGNVRITEINNPDF